MIADLMLRWVVTGLFALSGTGYAVRILTRRQPWTAVVSHSVHLVMAIAMVVMAWPWGARLPTTGPALFFLLATVWFVTMTVLAARTIAQRAVWIYHASMVAAMAWMYAVMDGHLLPGQSGAHHRASADMSMPGMDMATTHPPGCGGSPGWISSVNWFWLLGFAVAALYWVYRSVIERPRGGAGFLRSSLTRFGQAMMAAGMAIMFAAMLFRV
ncbi:DUF5134 domain-containing protein [Mycobacterium decipiens]|uniref:DUF5134 domain-containing protein n=1 Tax=Mycobacterium decipiens TaxID=1430326 RepID=A0A1X2LP29_9MYCO|nr:DUF5134 domain-containing protein [Mycobacterium decipiens]OSC36868.1 DUF5134 domain-containing protein [Mycobacterium decipiens]